MRIVLLKRSVFSNIFTNESSNTAIRSKRLQYTICPRSSDPFYYKLKITSRQTDLQTEKFHYIMKFFKYRNIYAGGRLLLG